MVKNNKKTTTKKTVKKKPTKKEKAATSKQASSVIDSIKVIPVVKVVQQETTLITSAADMPIGSLLPDVPLEEQLVAKEDSVVDEAYYIKANMAMEEKLGYKFKDPDLLERALTLAHGSKRAAYERLEFLGDRVVGLLVADALLREHPNEKEGDIAKRFVALTREGTLAALARDIGLNLFLRTKEPNLRQNKSILSDVMEALAGALFIDGGIKAARKWIDPLYADMVAETVEPPVDSKTVLQEWGHRQKLPLPVYDLVEKIGPDHEPIFRVSVQMEGYELFFGEGTSKKMAEQAAAAAFLAVHNPPPAPLAEGEKAAPIIIKKKKRKFEQLAITPAPTLDIEIDETKLPAHAVTAAAFNPPAKPKEAKKKRAKDVDVSVDAPVVQSDAVKTAAKKKLTIKKEPVAIKKPVVAKKPAAAKKSAVKKKTVKKVAKKATPKKKVAAK